MIMVQVQVVHYGLDGVVVPVAVLDEQSEMAAENFPSLPSSGNAAKNSIRAKLKSGSGGVSSNRTFAAMQSAATQPSSGWNGGGTTTTAAAAAVCIIILSILVVVINTIQVLVLLRVLVIANPT